MAPAAGTVTLGVLTAGVGTLGVVTVGVFTSGRRGTGIGVASSTGGAGAGGGVPGVACAGGDGGPVPAGSFVPSSTPVGVPLTGSALVLGARACECWGTGAPLESGALSRGPDRPEPSRLVPLGSEADRR